MLKIYLSWRDIKGADITVTAGGVEQSEVSVSVNSFQSPWSSHTQNEFNTGIKKVTTQWQYITNTLNVQPELIYSVSEL